MNETDQAILYDQPSFQSLDDSNQILHNQSVIRPQEVILPQQIQLQQEKLKVQLSTNYNTVLNKQQQVAEFSLSLQNNQISSQMKNAHTTKSQFLKVPSWKELDSHFLQSNNAVDIQAIKSKGENKNISQSTLHHSDKNLRQYQQLDNQMSSHIRKLVNQADDNKKSSFNMERRKSVLINPLDLNRINMQAKSQQSFANQDIPAQTEVNPTKPPNLSSFRKKSVRFTAEQTETQLNILSPIKRPPFNVKQPISAIQEIKKRRSMLVSNEVSPNKRLEDQNTVFKRVKSQFDEQHDKINILQSAQALSDRKVLQSQDENAVPKSFQQYSATEYIQTEEFAQQNMSISSTESEEEILPYPYNSLPVDQWGELKSQLKKVNAMLIEVGKEQSNTQTDAQLKKSVPLKSKIFAARLLTQYQFQYQREDSIQNQESILAKSFTHHETTQLSPALKTLEALNKLETVLQDRTSSKAIALESDDNSSSLWIIDNLIDFMFLCDIIINFNSPVINSDNVMIYDRKGIATEYLKSWFFIDLTASIPMNLIQKYLLDDVHVKNQNLTKLAKLPRFYRLIRMTRLFKFSKLAKKHNALRDIRQYFNMNLGMFRLIIYFFIQFLCVHLISCIWILSANFGSYGPNTWIAVIGIQDSSNYDIYLAALYWAFQTLLTVGYGDIHAFSNTIIWMFIGSFFYTFTIGNLSSVLSNLDTREAVINEKVFAITQFANDTNIDTKLKEQLKQAVAYFSQKNFLWSDKKRIFEELPPILRSQVAKEMHGGIIKTVKFFDDKDNNFIGSIVPMLTPLATLEGQIIFRKGTHANSVQFITKGRVSFFIERKNIAFKDMVQGGYFGEIDIVNKQPRQFTVISAIDCDILVLTRQIFEDIVMKEYPDVYEEIALLAMERQKRILKAKSSALYAYKRQKKMELKCNDMINQKPELIHQPTELVIDERDLFDFINKNDNIKDLNEEFKTEEHYKQIMAQREYEMNQSQETTSLNHQQKYSEDNHHELSKINESSYEGNDYSQDQESNQNTTQQSNAGQITSLNQQPQYYQPHLQYLTMPSLSKNKRNLQHQLSLPKIRVIKASNTYSNDVAQDKISDDNNSLKYKNYQKIHIASRQVSHKDSLGINSKVKGRHQNKLSIQYQDITTKLLDISKASNMTSIKDRGKSKQLKSLNNNSVNSTLKRNLTVFESNHKRTLNSGQYPNPNFIMIQQLPGKTLNEDDEEIIVKNQKRMSQYSIRKTSVLRNFNRAQSVFQKNDNKENSIDTEKRDQSMIISSSDDDSDCSSSINSDSSNISSSQEKSRSEESDVKSRSDSFDKSNQDSILKIHKNLRNAYQQNGNNDNKKSSLFWQTSPTKVYLKQQQDTSQLQGSISKELSSSQQIQAKNINTNSPYKDDQKVIIKQPSVGSFNLLVSKFNYGSKEQVVSKLQSENDQTVQEFNQTNQIQEDWKKWTLNETQIRDQQFETNNQQAKYKTQRIKFQDNAESSKKFMIQKLNSKINKVQDDIISQRQCQNGLIDKVDSLNDNLANIIGQLSIIKENLNKGYS